MLNVKVILGSTRPNRFSEKLVPWMQSVLAKHTDMHVEVLDLRDANLPFFESAVSPAYMQGTDYGNDAINAWSAKIAEADAYIFVVPEYNHGYTAVLKNSLDVIYREWANKPAAFVGYGGVGGSRAVEQLRQVLAELHMTSVRTAVHLVQPWFHFDEQGNPKQEYLDMHNTPFEEMLGQLQWWGDALQVARQK